MNNSSAIAWAIVFHALVMCGTRDDQVEKPTWEDIQACNVSCGGAFGSGIASPLYGCTCKQTPVNGSKEE